MTNNTAADLKITLALNELTRASNAVSEAYDAWWDAARTLTNIRLIGYASTAEEIAECEAAERRARRAHEAAEEARDQVWASYDAETLVAVARAS
jgi:hypothetical protein